MATTIGVYDSGIGGLTTLSVLMRKFPQCDFLYYADNARMPFGTKSPDEVKRVVNAAVATMSGECTRIVLGCNTASVTADPAGVFKLHPRLDGFSPSETLVLATPLTLAGLGAKEKGFLTADTRELAVLVEITASLKAKSRLRPDMSGLCGYLSEKLPREGVKRVVLGCSHYIYMSDQIAAMYPSAPLSDGNAAVVKEVEASLSASAPSAAHLTESRVSDAHPSEKAFAEPQRSAPSGFALPYADHGRTAEKYAPQGCRDDEEYAAEVYRVKFRFTGEREDKKYRWLLLHLLKTYAEKTAFSAI